MKNDVTIKDIVWKVDFIRDDGVNLGYGSYAGITKKEVRRRLQKSIGYERSIWNGHYQIRLFEECYSRSRLLKVKEFLRTNALSSTR